MCVNKTDRNEQTVLNSGNNTSGKVTSIKYVLSNSLYVLVTIITITAPVFVQVRFRSFPFFDPWNGVLKFGYYSR